MIIAESEIGFLIFDGNELTIGSKIDDPPKLRLTAPTTVNGGGGGVISFNRSRQAGVTADGHIQEEMAMLRVEQAEDVRGQEANLKAEFNFLTNDGLGAEDVNMVKPLAFTATGITRFIKSLRESFATWLTVPAVIAPLNPADVHPTAMWSPSGNRVTQQQDDGNFVTYDTTKLPWKPTWSAWTGKL